jgi:hypothetical protein
MIDVNPSPTPTSVMRWGIVNLSCSALFAGSSVWKYFVRGTVGSVLRSSARIASYFARCSRSTSCSTMFIGRAAMSKIGS